MKHLFRLLALASVATLGLAGCATQTTPVALADTLGRNPQLSTFNQLVAKAGMQEELRASGPLTVFAPSDAAFKAIPAKTLETLAADKAQLKAVLSYHMLSGKLASGDIKNGSSKTLQGGSVALARAGSFVTVEEAMVQEADLGASNGVVHVIDRVLMPPKK